MRMLLSSEEAINVFGEKSCFGFLVSSFEF